MPAVTRGGRATPARPPLRAGTHPLLSSPTRNSVARTRTTSPLCRATERRPHFCGTHQNDRSSVPCHATSARSRDRWADHAPDDRSPGHSPVLASAFSVDAIANAASPAGGVGGDPRRHDERSGTPRVGARQAHTSRKPMTRFTAVRAAVSSREMGSRSKRYSWWSIGTAPKRSLKAARFAERPDSPRLYQRLP